MRQRRTNDDEQQVRTGDGADLVGLVTPTGRDGSLAESVLGSAGIRAVACASVDEACALVERGAGALVIAEEALQSRGRDRLLAVLDAQPPWSDLPVVLLTGEGELSRTIPRELQAIATRANVTLLERPVRVATLVTTLRSALRARQRQFDVRDHLEERQRLLASERSARAQAEDSAARADEANRAKSEFLAMMSHELRTPLNAIAGYTQILEMEVRGPVNPEQRMDLERIGRSQRHLLSLINDLLNFAKLEAGHVDFSIAPTSVQAVLHDVEALILPQLREKQLQYSNPVDCRDTMVLADEEKVRQILLNVLSNAIKFTPPGGEIRLICEADDQVVRTVVEDSGRGIPQDKLESVFEPFVQLDRGFSARQEGTGLGLAISRNLARQMGGELSAASAPGTGAVLTLTLPRVRREDGRNQ